MYLECDKPYESHSGCKHPWLFVYIGAIGAKLIFAVGLKAKAGARAPQYPSKNPRMRFFRENNPSRKTLKLCSGSFHEDTDSRFVLKFHGNRPPGSGWNDASFPWKKVRKMRFFRRHFAPVWQTAPKVCKGACHVTPCLPMKVLPIGSDSPALFPKKVILYEYSRASQRCLTETMADVLSRDSTVYHAMSLHMHRHLFAELTKLHGWVNAVQRLLSCVVAHG